MRKYRLSPALIIGIIVAICFGVALYLRIALPYNQVFSGDLIRFTYVDAYHYMRLLDNLINNFPHLISFDPYMHYPNGAYLDSPNSFVYLLSGFVQLFGIGSPSQHTIDVVSAYFPAILGALTVIPVYFIGKELFNRWAGVLAAGLIAVAPGEFLMRTVLGSTDRDATQAFLTAVIMLFMILATKTARQKQLTLKCLIQRDWVVIVKPLIYSLLVGIFLGLYLLIWKGAFLVVFIFFIYLIIQFTIDYLKHKPTDYLCFVGVITFLVALIVLLPTSPDQIYLAPLVIALLTPPVLTGISWLMTQRKIKPAYYPLILTGLGVVALVTLYVTNASLLNAILANISRIFTQSTTRLTIVESMPILSHNGNFSFFIVWNNFTTGILLSFVSLGILVYLTIRRGETDKILLIIWSLVTLVFTLAMRRFALLFAINVALLASYVLWLFLEFTGFKKTVTKPLETLKKSKKAKLKMTEKSGFHLTSRHTVMAVGVVIVFLLSFFPSIGSIITVASLRSNTPSDAWMESLSWLKENTPAPFGDPDFYYDLYQTPFHYPETASGVVAWWDYGYWIIRIAQRPTNCDPGGGAREAVGRFFTAQDETSAIGIIDELKSQHVIIDFDTTIGKFYAVAAYAGHNEDRFSEVYYKYDETGQLMVPVTVYYPEYYRSLAVRLYHFDGMAVIPTTSTVISYQETKSSEGKSYKVITGIESFPSYEEANAYVLAVGSANHRIGYGNPFVSPVPLQELEHFKLEYQSDGLKEKWGGIGMIPEVKIFEYNQ